MQQIIDKRDIVRIEIDLKHNKWEHNTSEDSFYTEINNEKSSINERCSFHYPVLERWLQMAMKRFQAKKSKYNPLQGDNIAFVFHDKRTEGTTNANISSNLMEGAQKMFKSSNNFIVTLYDWDLDILTKDEIKLVFRNINASFAGNEFSDPLANTEHRANVTPVEAMLVRKNNNKTNENRNMKKTIRLTESDLRKLVMEAINELDKDTYNNYWEGRNDQRHGRREMSPARIRRGKRDLEKDKKQGYPCGGAKTGEQYAKMGIDSDVFARNLALRAGSTNPQYGSTENLDESIRRAIRKLLH